MRLSSQNSPEMRPENRIMVFSPFEVKSVQFHWSPIASLLIVVSTKPWILSTQWYLLEWRWMKLLPRVANALQNSRILGKHVGDSGNFCVHVYWRLALACKSSLESQAVSKFGYKHFACILLLIELAPTNNIPSIISNVHCSLAWPWVESSILRNESFDERNPCDSPQSLFEDVHPTPQ